MLVCRDERRVLFVILVVLLMLIFGNPVSLRLFSIDTDVRKHLVRMIYFTSSDLLGVNLFRAKFCIASIVGLIENLRRKILLFLVKCANFPYVRSFRIGFTWKPFRIWNYLHTLINFSPCFIVFYSWVINFTHTNIIHVRIIGSLLSSSPFDDDA